MLCGKDTSFAVKPRSVLFSLLLINQETVMLRHIAYEALWRHQPLALLTDNHRQLFGVIPISQV